MANGTPKARFMPKAAAKKPAKKTVAAPNKPAAKPPKEKPAKVKLLSGGNPQIAKGDGDAPVQAYIDAMPGWKSEAGRRLDALITRTLPRVKKAVKWNSPFYGVEGNGWFMGVHCFNKYIKVAFFKGVELKPALPFTSKDPNTRYFHINEDGVIDEKLVAGWIKQAAKLPGWMS
jgi:hypothetical protein